MSMRKATHNNPTGDTVAMPIASIIVGADPTPPLNLPANHNEALRALAAVVRVDQVKDHPRQGEGDGGLRRAGEGRQADRACD